MSVKEEKEYPEHLNPFHKTRNGLSQSFRGLKKSLFGSFRRKDKEPQPELRRNAETVPQNRHTVSVIPKVEISDYTPLPRSRFSERLTKSPEPKPRKWVSNESVGRNPFDEEEKNKEKLNETNNSNETPPIAAERKKLKRRKKKAPIPPNNVSGENQYLNIPPNINTSKWSLTSTDTDISSACYSENEIDYTIPELTRNEEILQITKEIEKFTDDTNNNFIIKNSSNEVSNKDNYEIKETTVTNINMKIHGTDVLKNESLEITEMKDVDDDVQKNIEIDVTNLPRNESLEITEMKDVDNVQENIEIDDLPRNESAQFEEINKESIKIQAKDDVRQLSESELQDSVITEVISNDHPNNSKIEYTKSSIKDIEKNDSEENVIAETIEVASYEHSNNSKEGYYNVDIQNNNFDNESEQNVQNTKDETFQLTYFESQTIFVNDSQDERDKNILYNERASLLISGSTDELEKSGSDNSIRGKIQYFEEISPTKHEASQVLKVRQNILSKEVLLGSENK